MFSTITEVPLAIVNVLANIDCISVGNPGYGIVFILTAFSFLGECKYILFFPTSILHPASSSLFKIGVICSGVL